MYKLFNNILIPVTFSSASDRLIEKGIEFANLYCCNIHLLHITSSPLKGIKKGFAGLYPTRKKNTDITDIKGADSRLKKLVNKYHDQLRNGLKIIVHSENGNTNDVAIDYIVQNHIDLVWDVVPASMLRPGKSHFDANKIASRTNVAVITIPEYRKLNHLYLMVIPVTDFMPLKKLMYCIYLAQHFNTTIHLLGITDKENYTETKRVQKYLQRSYQLIRDNSNASINMTIKDGQNIAKTVKEYAADKHADLVIVNSENQNDFNRTLSGFFARLLQKKILLPILTVKQA